MARRGQPAALSAESQTGYLAYNGGRTLAPRDLRLQAEAGRDAQRADAGKLHQGQTDRAVAGTETAVLRTTAQVPQVRQIRRRDLRTVRADRFSGGRNLHHPLDDH